MHEFFAFLNRHPGWQFMFLGLFAILGLLLLFCIGLIGSWKEKRKRRTLSYILAEFGGVKILGTIGKGKHIFVCPVCYLLSPEQRMCPNHEHPVEMKLGKSSELEYYHKKQRLMKTEMPDDDDHGRRPWE